VSSFHRISFVFQVSLYLLLSLFAIADSEQPPLESTDNTEKPHLIRQIAFEGLEHLGRKQLSKLIDIDAGQPYLPTEMVAGLNRVLEKYREDGFVFASIEPEVTTIPPDQVQIRVHIHEGTRARTGKITIEGNHLLLTGDLRRAVGLREGAPFSQTAFEGGIDKVLALYSERGYPKAEIEPTDFHLSEEQGKVDLRLQIREGNQVRIGAVKLTGLQKTKPEVVLRELPVQAGDVFDQRKIDQSFHRLVNLGYFYEVSPFLLEEGTTPEEIIFNAKVTEARTGRFSGVIGYAPPTTEFEGAPQLTGVIEATEANLLGTGRGANFLWKSGLLRTLRIGYTEPWAFGKPIKIGVEYSQVNQRNQFTDAESNENAASVTVGARFRRLFEGSLGFSYKRIGFPTSDILLPTTSPLLPSQIIDAPNPAAQSGVKYGIILGFTRDSRDYFLNPTRGRLDHVAFEFSRGDFKLRKLWIDLRGYYPTWRRQVIAIGLHGAAAWGDNIPPTELFYLGGANTLRGYDEDWFFGPRRVYANIEYRLLVGRTSQFFVFTDLGAVTQVDQPTVFDPLRVGYGFGMRLESKGGLLRMDYGLAEGRSALEGKIHVNLGTSF
jgi:outer membrane protein insertion porin family